MEINNTRVYEGRPKSRMVLRPFVTSASAFARPVIAARPSEGAFSHFLYLGKTPNVRSVRLGNSCSELKEPLPQSPSLINFIIGEMIASLTRGKFA